MSLSSVVAVKTVEGEPVAQLSTTVLGQVAGLDFTGHSDETVGLYLFLAFHDDDVLAQATASLAIGDAAAQHVLAVWTVVTTPATFPRHLELHGDFAILVSRDRSVRVAVCASTAHDVLSVTFASPTPFKTDIIVSLNHLTTSKGETTSARQVHLGGNVWLYVFQLLAAMPNGLQHLQRRLAHAMMQYGTLRYNVTRPATDAFKPLAPFAEMLNMQPTPPSLPPRTPAHSALTGEALARRSPSPFASRPPQAPGPDMALNEPSSLVSPWSSPSSGFGFSHQNNLSPESLRELERRYASPLLLANYPSPIRSSPLLMESPPFDVHSSPPQAVRPALLLPKDDDDNDLADQTLNMSVDDIEDDEYERGTMVA
ncbi:hypothetical protein SPRG_11276 [Saprolegnia parasitica CBS 223.65]|uniref:Uncharacterized protein n=1 Tax=Saprolegnia parasitica (strain CBS 223.65) TaxID=695850 RepID=A0A067BZ96_SAPPC|nr:hypothetical protein SPRG_11276 [Saprolegnia parasitica CBS 223.65]KDO23844.1 hypothetical protein SPRG_11276 [Saprolegnia parasitica CBS 223.65]|eukprot:XP_012205477.1 hypothetical protein SPRG_11276 [Saprolegnia parasitica CBS 223.65]